MKPLPSLLLCFSVCVLVVIALYLVFLVEHPASAPELEGLTDEASQREATSNNMHLTLNNHSIKLNTEQSTQQTQENPVTLAEKKNDSEETKTYFLSTRAIADAGKSDMAKRAFSIPPGWQVLSIEKTESKGRTRIVESDGIIFAEAHAFSKVNGHRDEAYITAQITLVKE